MPGLYFLFFPGGSGAKLIIAVIPARKQVIDPVGARFIFTFPPAWVVVYTSRSRAVIIMAIVVLLLLVAVIIHIVQVLAEIEK